MLGVEFTSLCSVVVLNLLLGLGGVTQLVKPASAYFENIGNISHPWIRKNLIISLNQFALVKLHVSLSSIVTVNSLEV